MRSFIFVILLMFAVCEQVMAQTEGKHPRVAELENQLSKDASDFFKSRFPGTPFLVNITVDPLRRLTNKAIKNTESLPYMNYYADEIGDEWDDPAKSNFELLNRSRKITVNVSVPLNVSEKEIEDFQEALIPALGLVKARDAVVIQRKEWQAQGINYWAYVAVFSFILLALYFALFYLVRSSVSKFSQALSKQAPQSSTSSSQGSGAVSSPVQDQRSGISSDVTVSDPIRLREAIGQSIKFICQNREFPTLEDMIVFDKMAKVKPHGLGAILNEFPKEIRDQIFSYSFSQEWLISVTEPGELNSTSLDVIQKMAQVHRDANEDQWQKLLIVVWRMDQDLVGFIKTLQQEEAFCILHYLPKSISVSVARKAFPGSWGVLLDQNYKPAKVSAIKIGQLTEQAIKACPLRNTNLIEKFRRDKDLLTYLKTADPNEEREIYQASPKDSIIHQTRVPFYTIFDLADEELSTVVSQVSIDDWSLALLNIDRNYRKNIESHMTDKQRFMLVEKLKFLDQNPPDALRIGATREKIAEKLKAIMHKKEQQSETSSENATPLAQAA